MNLLFYSGGTEYANKQLDEELYSFIEKKRNPRMTFIPSCSWDSDRYYKEIKTIYRKVGFHSVDCFVVDAEFSSKQLAHALDSDAIYLSGGNTFYFLKYLRQSGVLPKLRAFVERGGILMGLSAGSIIMTPHIMMASIPRGDADTNDVRLKNLNALKLVHFEYCPHYEGKKRVDEELKRYSRGKDHPIYAAPDGSGIVVKDGKMSFVGEIFSFVRGEKFYSL